jgi:hypothetical protein
MKLLQWSDSPVDSWLIHGSRLSQETGWRFGWSEAEWEAWEELNLRLHPYQQSRAYRHPILRFPRSRATVRGQVMRSKPLAPNARSS